MTIEPLSLAIGILLGFVLAVLANVRVVRGIALSLKRLGVELGIEADDYQPGGVQLGDVGGDISGDVAGRDINKRTSNFYKNLQKAIKSGDAPDTLLVVEEHVNVEFPDTPDGMAASALFRGLPEDRLQFLSEENRRILRPYIERYEEKGWKVRAVRWSDNGRNGYYATFQLESSA